MNVEIATPARKYSIEDVISCTAPGVMGNFQVLAGHTALISELSAGEVKIQMQDKTQYYAVSGGFLEVLDNRVLLLLEAAEPAEEINTDRATEAQERAKKRLETRSPDTDMIRAEAALSRAANRLKVAGRASSS